MELLMNGSWFEYLRNKKKTVTVKITKITSPANREIAQTLLVLLIIVGINLL